MLKKVLIGVGAVFVLFIAFMILTASLLGLNNKPKGVHEEKMSVDGATKKALVIYQPGGTSSNIAHQIAKGINDGGYEVVLNYPGQNLKYDISEYSVVVFGSPVYAGQPSKAVTDYMATIKDYSKTKVALYSVGMLENKVEIDTMENNLNGKKADEKIKFTTGQKNVNDSIAYELGKKLSKE